MNRRARKKKLMADINITPFTDVILVLLVIFMITTPLISQIGIKVNLPSSARAAAIEGASNQVMITLTNEGSMYFGNELITRKELRNRLSSLYKDNPEVAVVMRADKLVRFKEVVGAFDILSEIGIHNLTIAAVNEE